MADRVSRREVVDVRADRCHSIAARGTNCSNLGNPGAEPARVLRRGARPVNHRGRHDRRSRRRQEKAHDQHNTPLRRAAGMAWRFGRRTHRIPRDRNRAPTTRASQPHPPRRLRGATRRRPKDKDRRPSFLPGEHVGYGVGPDLETVQRVSVRTWPSFATMLATSRRSPANVVGRRLGRTLSTARRRFVTWSRAASIPYAQALPRLRTWPLLRADG